MPEEKKGESGLPAMLGGMATILVQLHKHHTDLLKEVGTGTGFQGVGFGMMALAVIVRILSCVSTPKLIDFPTLDFAILLIASLLLVGFGAAVKLIEYRGQSVNYRKFMEFVASEEQAARVRTDTAAGTQRTSIVG
jgi:hypothetical protein